MTQAPVTPEREQEQIMPPPVETFLFDGEDEPSPGPAPRILEVVGPAATVPLPIIKPIREAADAEVSDAGEPTVPDAPMVGHRQPEALKASTPTTGCRRQIWAASPSRN